jgi:hypothetical protein
MLGTINDRVYRPDYRLGIGNSDYLRIEMVLSSKSRMGRLVRKHLDEAVRIFNTREYLPLGELICRTMQEIRSIKKL